jgi:hypothetical protein
VKKKFSIKSLTTPHFFLLSSTCHFSQLGALKEVTSPSNLSSESPENIFGTILLNCTCVVVGGLQKKYFSHFNVPCPK